MTAFASACPVCAAPARPRLTLPGFVVYACPACGHEFSGNFAPGVREPYGPDYFQVVHANWFAHPDTVLHDALAQTIVSRLGPNPSVIDIGCGNGNFLRHLAQRGLTRLTGLDILDQTLPQGIRYLKTPIEDHAGDETFQAVVSLANIEHIEDVGDYLDRLVGLLAPGGLIAIYTVDNASLLYRLAKGLADLGLTFAARRLYDPHHVNHFSVGSLDVLAASRGLTRISLTRRNIPAKAVDLPGGFTGLAVAGATRLIDLAARIGGREMLQLALFTRADEAGPGARP